MTVTVHWTGEETPRFRLGGLSEEQAHATARYCAGRLRDHGYRVKGNPRTGYAASDRGKAVARIAISEE